MLQIVQFQRQKLGGRVLVLDVLSCFDRQTDRQVYRLQTQKMLAVLQAFNLQHYVIDCIDRKRNYKIRKKGIYALVLDIRSCFDGQTDRQTDKHVYQLHTQQMPAIQKCSIKKQCYIVLCLDCTVSETEIRRKGTCLDILSWFDRQTDRQVCRLQTQKI